MKQNMGSIDRILRVILAIVIGVLIYLKVITGSLAIILGITAGILVVTSFISFCPLYVPFGISTKK